MMELWKKKKKLSSNTIKQYLEDKVLDWSSTRILLEVFTRGP